MQAVWDKLLAQCDICLGFVGCRRLTEADVGLPDRERFVLELEFIQCLASPQYLNWLAQNRYFEDPAFLNYLKYLQYWRKPEYARFIIYPHALQFLALLQTPEFRTAIANPSYMDTVHSQQFYHWQHFRSNRVAEALQQQQRHAAHTDGEGGKKEQLQQPGEPGS
ncbi:hypothetical protein N2152v2_010651 [Parachlorella kessleri]